MRAVLIAVLCFLLGATKGEAASVSFGPVYATDGSVVYFEGSVNYDEGLLGPKGNGTLTLAQFNSYCLGVYGGLVCRTTPGRDDFGYISFSNFLPGAWFLTAERFATTFMFIDVSGSSDGSSILGQWEGYFGEAQIAGCLWDQGCASATPVPAPAALPLLGAGLASLYLLALRRRGKSKAASQQ